MSYNKVLKSNLQQVVSTTAYRIYRFYPIVDPLKGFDQKVYGWSLSSIATIVEK